LCTKAGSWLGASFAPLRSGGANRGRQSIRSITRKRCGCRNCRCERRGVPANY
jgi:hypothetical protein